jgi:hypothetical protein
LDHPSGIPNLEYSFVLDIIQHNFYREALSPCKASQVC